MARKHSLNHHEIKINQLHHSFDIRKINLLPHTKLASAILQNETIPYAIKSYNIFFPSLKSKNF